MIPSLEDAAVEERRERIVEECDALTSVRDKLLDQREQLDMASSRLPSLREKKAECESDCEALREEISRGKQSEERYDRKIAEMQKYLQGKREELSRVQAHKRELQVGAAVQERHVDERERERERERGGVGGVLGCFVNASVRVWLFLMIACVSRMVGADPLFALISLLFVVGGGELRRVLWHAGDV